MVVLGFSGCEWLPHCILSPLKTSVLGSIECKWLSCLTVFQPCWWCLSQAEDPVSSCHTSLHFNPADDACPWLCRMWVAAVPWSVSILLMIAALTFFRMWVVVIPGFISILLIVLIIGSPVGKWLPCFAVFKLDHSWLCRKWVAAVPYSSSILLTTPVYCSLVCEWLPCLAALQFC